MMLAHHSQHEQFFQGAQMKNKLYLLLVVTFLIALIFAPFFERKGEKTEQTEVVFIDDGMLQNQIPSITIRIGWTSDLVNVCQEMDKTSNSIGCLEFNKKIEYWDVNGEWSCIEYGNYEQAYIESKYIQDEQVDFYEVYAPSNSGFKSYMSYKAITNTGSPQYRLQSQFAYGGSYGCRMVEGRYCIAIGTGFGGSVGTYIDLILENGTTIPCIVGDIKSNEHTLGNNITTAHNGCVSEFLVDVNYLDKNAKISGNMESCNSDWRSPLEKAIVYERNILK
jgi:hypothetical protein